MISRLTATAAIGALVMVTAAGTLVSVERAIVTISVQPKAVNVAGIQLTGGTARNNLTTRQLVASAAESLTVASDVRQLPATLAAGFVYFWCSPMSSCPNGYTVPAGTVLGSVGGASYLTEYSATFPSCQPSTLVAIHAETAGAVGNTGAATVVHGRLPGYIHVTNSSPIVGGANARTVSIVTQANIDTARATLTTKVDAALNAELRVEAGSLAYLPVGPPVFKVASDSPVGAAAPTVTVTVRGTLQSVAFSTKDALTLLRSLLAGDAPSGYALAPTQVTATYSWDPASSGLTASAAADAVPVIDAATLTTGIRGEGLSQAIAGVQRAVPASTVTIRTGPFASPWLPVLADHISVELVANPI